MESHIYRNLESLPHIHRIVKTLFHKSSMKNLWTNEHPELFYVIKNGSRTEIGGKTYDISPGDIILIPPGVPHRGFVKPDNADGVFQIMIIFSWKASDYLLGKVHFDSLLKIPPNKKKNIVDIMTSMRMEQSGRDEMENLMLRSKLHAVLIEILNYVEEINGNTQYLSGNKSDKFIGNAKKFMDDHYTETIALKDISDELCISPYYLSHLFRKECGFTVFSYLAELRLNKAKELIEDGRMTISEVASTVGYNNKSYFTQAFRNYFGMNPSAHLKNLKRAAP